MLLLMLLFELGFFFFIFYLLRRLIKVVSEVWVCRCVLGNINLFLVFILGGGIRFREFGSGLWFFLG